MRTALRGMLLVVVAACALAGPLARGETPFSPTGLHLRHSPVEQTGPDTLYPDPALTPGDVFPDATADQICQYGYPASVRNVTALERMYVFRRYGTTYVPRAYEVDHFIPLELGGSNTVENLWPEPYEPRPGAREKDMVENYLHGLVCNGTISLQDGQDAIRGDWYAIYLGIYPLGGSALDVDGDGVP